MTSVTQRVDTYKLFNDLARLSVKMSIQENELATQYLE